KSHSAENTGGITLSVKTPPIPAENVRRQNTRSKSSEYPQERRVDRTAEHSDNKPNDDKKRGRKIADANEAFVVGFRIYVALIDVLYQVRRTAVDRRAERRQKSGKQCRKHKSDQADRQHRTDN